MKNSNLSIKRVTINPKSKKKSYIYLDKNNNQIKDPETLNRIKKIVIPPAYTDIRIANSNNNYLQAVGTDDKGRKQYIYKKSFVDKQSKNKYCQLKNIGANIERIRKDVRALMLSNKPIDNKDKMIALVIYILDNCYFRIGNIHYFNNHESHGVSTLQCKHLKFKNQHVDIDFIGKKGVRNQCSITDSLAIKLLKDLCHITKKENHQHQFIFHYKNDNENEKNNGKESNEKYKLIKPLDINTFLNKYHPDITLKMFRTWGANYIFLEEIIKQKHQFMTIANLEDNENKKNNKQEIEKESDKIIKEILKTIAIKLHNTPTVSKKSYLDNNLIQIYLSNPKSFWNKINKSENKKDLTILLSEFLNKNCVNRDKKTKMSNHKGGILSFFM
jgi:DNA topoisomerase-1